MICENKIFGKEAWSDIDSLLPNNEEVKRYVLSDFMWFISKPRNKNTNYSLITEYAHHLRLKANPKFIINIKEVESFKSINIDKIIKKLLSVYK